MTSLSNSPSNNKESSFFVQRESLMAERKVLMDSSANLTRRLEALYSLKHAAFEVHPRINAIDKAICRAASEGNIGGDSSESESSASSTEATAGATSASATSASTGSPATPPSPWKNNNSNNINSLHQKNDVSEIVSFVVDAFHDSIDTTDSVLLQHELLYNIGQMGCSKSLPVCIAVIKDHKKYHEVSRHEAVEAIGALGYPDEGIACLEKLMKELPSEAKTAPITESVELAIERLRLVKKNGHAHVLREHANPEFVSVDPAPSNGIKDLNELRSQLLGSAVPLFTRYQAMFALRNLNNKHAVGILCEALTKDTTSCLFRHEIAFVLGQLESEHSVGALKTALANEKEHGMVRHEAAEALGAIGNKECTKILNEYVKHKDRLVADSCYAALQLMDQVIGDAEDRADVMVCKYEDK